MRDYTEIESDNTNAVAQEILLTAIKWLQNQEVENPFKGCRGIDNDAVSKAVKAIEKVCSL